MTAGGLEKRMAQIIHNMPFAEYAASPGLNASTLKAFRESAAHGAAKMSKPDDPGDSMILGRLLHAAVEHGIDIALAGSVDVPCKTTDAKAYREAVESGANTVLCDGWRERIIGMHSAIMRHPKAQDLLGKSPQSEVSIFWDDPDLGVPCKMRADWLVPGTGVVDIKSSSSASSRYQIGLAIHKYGYHMQAAWYMRGYKQAFSAEHCAFRFVFVESSDPFCVAVTDLGAETIAQGWAECCQAAEWWKRWKATGEAPGFADDCVITVDLPGWAQLPKWSAPFEL